MTFDQAVKLFQSAELLKTLPFLPIHTFDFVNPGPDPDDPDDGPFPEIYLSFTYTTEEFAKEKFMDQLYSLEDQILDRLSDDQTVWASDHGFYLGDSTKVVVELMLSAWAKE